MQPVNGPGAPAGDRPSRASGASPQSNSDGQQPLTPAQRTTLERLIVRIMSISTLKAPELWAGLRHDLGIHTDARLLSVHFPTAETYLTTRLEQAQDNLAVRQLMQQLIGLLPQGNNRQAVSDFIRQQFGQTVLSALNPEQLRQVLTMLQTGQMTIPQPQQNQTSERTLLPAEMQTLNQQVAKLAATTGESSARVWVSVLNLVGLKNGDPIPLQHFPLLTHYLQARQTLGQHDSPTLQMLEAALRQPLTREERQTLENYVREAFMTTPVAILTQTQALDVLNMLFSRRADRERTNEQLQPASEWRPVPLWGAITGLFQTPRPGGSLFGPLLAAALIFVLLMWLL